MLLHKVRSIKVFMLLLLCAASINNSYSQDLVNDISSGVTLGDSQEMFTETIRIIGRSRKVFVITNTNQMLFKGDFITIVLDEREAVARAVVAKNQNDLVGIKILRIYSLKNWKRIRKDLDVKILKGDDSWLFKKEEPKVETNPDAGIKINSEEDLYDEDTLLNQDLDSFGKDTRLIKPDNIVSAAYARYSLDNPFANGGEGEVEAFNEFNGSWAYQFADNIWVEGTVGFVTMDNVPANSTQTVLTDLIVRLKYTFQAPLYSYFQPYIGYQYQTVSSPNAGKAENNEALNERELDFIDQLPESRVVVGVTVLRRLVPGWFLKGDLGTDILAIGFGIEF